MVNSMTGYGRGEAEGEGKQITVELKSVNHRYLETVVRLPRQYNSLEEKIKRVIQEKVSRGRVEVYLNFAETGEKKRFIKVDKDLALAYDKTLEDLAKTLDISYSRDLYRLVGMPDVMSVEDSQEDLDAIWAVCNNALLLALTAFIEMRGQEGSRLQEDLIHRIDKIAQCIKEIEVRQPQVVKDYQEKLHQRLAELLVEITVDENRMANEVASFADRISITEELVRLHSHLAQFKASLNLKEPIGRKLDFLLQELNREINTTGSKANDMEIARIVVEVKSELEKIREQVQNLE
ncbi:MAG TPA: YicC/YloC family endoribonuclease [Candidatus Deferrimicrobium sp.]|nr:YicC/YloC family endoribonuclease [Candidatus Deferrimicrobium sp.]